MTTSHRPGGLNHRNSFPTVLAVGSPRLGATGSWPGEPSFPALEAAAFLLCPHTAFSPCGHIPGVSLSPYEDTCPIGIGISFNLNYFLKAQPPDSLSAHLRNQQGSATPCFESKILENHPLAGAFLKWNQNGSFYLLFIHPHSSYASLLSKPVSEAADWWVTSPGTGPALVWALSFSGFQGKTADLGPGPPEVLPHQLLSQSPAFGIEQFIHSGQ